MAEILRSGMIERKLTDSARQFLVLLVVEILDTAFSLR